MTSANGSGAIAQSTRGASRLAGSGQPAAPPAAPKLVPLLLTIIGLLVAILGFVVAWQQYTRSKRMFALTEIVAPWNEDTGKLKDAIEHAFPGIYNQERFDQLTSAAAHALFSAQEGQAVEIRSGSMDAYRVRQSIVELLNYFEYVAASCDTGVADESIVRSFAGGAMKRWGKALRPFIEVYNNERQGNVWAPYYAAVDRWGLDVCLFQDHSVCPSTARGEGHASESL